MHRLIVCVRVCVLECAHRPSQRERFSVNCNAKIPGEKERNDVSSHGISPVLLPLL